MTEIKAVCFDIDGTLYPKWRMDWNLLWSVFPSPLMAYRFNKFRRKVRLATEERTVPATLEGYRLRQAISLSGREQNSIPAEHLSHVLRAIDRQFYARWERSFTNVKAFPGVRETFMLIRELGAKVGVLSDFPLGAKLEALGVVDLVDFACCSEESGYLKPHPAPFQLLAKHLGVEFSQMLYVGDSYSKDIMGAGALGISSCLLVPHLRAGRGARVHTQLYPQATLVCRNFEELQRYIRSLFESVME